MPIELQNQKCIKQSARSPAPSVQCIYVRYSPPNRYPQTNTRCHNESLTFPPVAGRPRLPKPKKLDSHQYPTPLATGLVLAQIPPAKVVDTCHIDSSFRGSAIGWVETRCETACRTALLACRGLDCVVTAGTGGRSCSWAWGGTASWGRGSITTWAWGGTTSLA